MVFSFSPHFIHGISLDSGGTGGPGHQIPHGVPDLLIWPYAVAPVVAGALWMFMFDPTLGIVAYFLQFAGVDWNHRTVCNHAMMLIILAASETDLL